MAFADPYIVDLKKYNFIFDLQLTPLQLTVINAVYLEQIHSHVNLNKIYSFLNDLYSLGYISSGAVSVFVALNAVDCLLNTIPAIDFYHSFDWS